jgi:hypothetical protein
MEACLHLSTVFGPRGFFRVPCLIFALLLGGLLPGCSPGPTGPGDNNNDNEPAIARASDCVGCHTDETMLKLVAEEEPPPPEDAGEG